MADTKPALKLVDIDENYTGAEVTKRHLANAIKEGRRRERGALLSKLGAKTLEEASQLAQIRAERDARPTASEEAKHGRFRFYQGVAAGLLTGLVATSALMLFVVARMNEQTRASTEAGVMIGTAATAQSGEPLVSPNYNRDYTRAPREPGDAQP